MSEHRSAKHQSVPVAKLTVPVDEHRDHIQGAPNAAVTLVEYGDYQCPYCGAAYPIVKRVQQSIGEPLRFVFRNFPLTQMHPHAEFAAELAESAGSHGKFWEMHDFIYEHQSSLDQPEVFLRFGQERLGLDTGVLENAIAQHTFLERIRDDFMSGARSGVNGTPTFYIDGVRHDGSFDFETLSSALRAALAERRKT